MKNVYRATRPTWSQMDKSEMRLILIASIVLALIGPFGEFLVHDEVLTNYKQIPPLLVHGAWGIIEIILVTFGCLLIIRYYKKLSVGCYPTTFIYCFSMPEASNPSGKSQVVGYCHVRPNAEIGEIEVVGASFFWENGQLNTGSRVGFTSSQVRGSKEKEETTCHIRFNINAPDSSKRFYRHGLLQFRLDKTTGLNGGATQDMYAGYLQSTHKDSEIQDIEIRSKGYAEWHNDGPLREDDVQTTLRRRGDQLVTSLQAMLVATPPPTLWEGTGDIELKQGNFWRLPIPTPQSVMLNKELEPHIDKLLSKMLHLAGLEDQAIGSFKELAKRAAILNRDDIRVAYERALKGGLLGMIKQGRLNATLNKRAQIIKGQIEPFLEGDSLLDIGCGNGMISLLVRDHFKERILLLDVVDYLPKQLGLDSMLYEDGEPLPVSEKFDTVLLITVLHHSNNPLELLKLAWGATRKKLIIIESVVGIHSLEPGVKYELVNSSDENQIGYAAFVDWFYNRVLHEDVPVPYNFTTPEKWTSVFAEQHMKIAKVTHLGQDIDIGPEYHILFVLQKE